MLLISNLAMLRPYQRSLIYQIGAVSFNKEHENQHDCNFDMLAEKERMDTKKAADIAKRSESHIDKQIYHLL